MALSSITFQQGSGGLGRPLPGQDFISGLIFYSSVLPSGFTTQNNILKFLSPNDAVNAGISYSYTDGTKATGTYTVSAIGGNGDLLSILATEPYGVQVKLGTYTKVSGDSTTTLVATGIAAAINANTNTTGYTATAAGAVVTIIARAGLGIFLNTGTPLVVQITGTIAGTLTQFTGGVASRNAVYYYHITEFFRLQPQGVLYVGIFPVPGPYAFTEITTMQNFASGTIRQIGIFKDSGAFATADLTTIDAVSKANDTGHAPLVALYAADLSGTPNIASLTDLSLLQANTASAVISQDGGGMGALLYLIFGKSITNLGAALGATALAAVNEDIGWVGKFNISNGVECETLAFANGQLLSSNAISSNLLTTLDSYRYVFLLKYVGKSGSYFSKANAAVSISSNYAFINDNRTIQKAKRGIYAALLPVLNSPLILTSAGLLANTTIAYLVTLAQAPLTQMVKSGEISANGVKIDPTQNVLSTGTLIITIQIVPDGVAREILIPIGYTQSIS